MFHFYSQGSRGFATPWPYCKTSLSYNKQYRSSPVKEISCKEEKIDERFIDVIDQVYKIYGSFTGIELSMLTHEKNSPWEITWNSGKSIISNDLIAYYYKKMNSQS